jgi:pyruvate dehydrogenase E2 component (dihydrolipoyllysine-residue acetyltransferase)
MPALGADMEAGKLVEWLVKPGQHVKRGEVVAIVETEKGAVEVEIWEGGTVDELIVELGTIVPEGTVLATLHGEGEAAPVAPAPAVARGPVAPVAPIAPAAKPAPVAVATERYKISPAARRKAQELGVDLAKLVPSGPEGVISLADVEQAAPAGVAPAPQPADRMEAMRRAIAAAMSKSKREIPHYYLANSIDVTAAGTWLARENAARSVQNRLLFAAVLLRAVVLALKEVPELNGVWVDDRLQMSQQVHLGVGIALRGGGLVAPAIRNAQDKTIPEMMAAVSDLIRRARAGSLRSSELSEATVTVTNLGEQGTEAVYGIIYPPQVALVGFGRVSSRPWVVDGTVQVRDVVQATLSADHRASVGHRGAVFLSALDRLLQQPEKL